MAQEGTTIFNLSAGAGNYSGINLGVSRYAQGQYVRISAGYLPAQFSGNYFSLAGTYGMPIVKRENSFLGGGIKLNLWQLDNEVNSFLFLGSGVELLYRTKLSERIAVILAGGIMYNSMLHYERKSAEEIGWPVEWTGIAELSFEYRLR